MEPARHKTVNRAATPRISAAARPALALMRASGARVQRQSAVRVSSPKDPAEREAEATAKKIMRMPEPGPASPLGDGTPSRGGSGIFRRLESPSLARFAESVHLMHSREAPVIARKSDGGDAVPGSVAGEIANAKAGGAPLPKDVKAFMEPRFRADFGNVRIHKGERSVALNQKIRAQAFTHGNHVFFGKDKFKPDTHEGKELIAHELTHTIQQGAAVQRSPDVSVSEHAGGDVVHRLGMSDILDFFADKANMIPGFRMFTIVLGVNPINMSAVEASAANILRAIVEFMPGGGIITQALDKYGVFDKVGAWVEGQLKSLGITGASIKAALTQFISSLGLSDLLSPGSVWDRAKAIFSGPIDRIIAFVKSLAAKVLEFIKDAILRPLAALAQQTPGWDLLCAVLGRNPITGDAVPRTAETLIGGFMKLIGQEEIWENIKKGNAIARAFAWFQNALNGLMGFVRQIPALFIAALKALTIQDVILLPAALVKVAKAFGNFFAQFVSWAGSTIWDLLEIIFSVVAPAVIGYVKKAAGAFKQILKNPIGFVRNLVAAGKQGLSGFASNFVTHLKAALINWLTGALSGAGIYIPTSISLVEIGKCVLSVLGITWPKIRAKLVKVIGEKAMGVLEEAFPIVVALFKGGPAAAWELIKQKLADLRDMVLQSIITFVAESVVKRAIARLVGMLVPGGAFIQAILTIYDTIMVFVERLQQIAAVVAAFIDGIAAIASGAIGAAAKRVESVMAGLLSLVVAFLAKFAGLGKVTGKIVELLKKLQAKVDAAIDFAINWVVGKAKAFLATFKGKGKKDARTDAEKDKDKRAGIAAAEKLVPRKGFDEKATIRKLGGIKEQYRLSSLNLVVDSKKDGKEKLHFTASASEEVTGNPIETEADSDQILDPNEGLAGTYPQSSQRTGSPKTKIKGKTGTPKWESHHVPQKVLAKYFGLVYEAASKLPGNADLKAKATTARAKGEGDGAGLSAVLLSTFVHDAVHSSETAAELSSLAKEIEKDAIVARRKSGEATTAATVASLRRGAGADPKTKAKMRTVFGKVFTGALKLGVAAVNVALQGFPEKKTIGAPDTSSWDSIKEP